MDLLVASYDNIGPFRTPMSVRFSAGKYLIKAAIGSGKSFLFFDGPVFALYKHASRPLLNRLSKTGRIDLLFMHAGSYRLIQRQLTRTKQGGDSVKSRLFSVNYTGDDLLADIGWTDDIISYGGSVSESLHQYLEEISFTNQKEVDKHLGDLLPPKEVLMSVNFLMQDADNIFELPPTERVHVFKHLFGLIGIDHAKDSIRDARKEHQVKIQIHGDTSRSDEALKQHVREILAIQEKLCTGLGCTGSLQNELLAVFKQPFFVDLPMIQDNVGIEHFKVDVDDESIIALQTSLLGYIRTTTQQQTQQEHLISQLQDSIHEEKKIIEKIAKIQREQSLLQERIAYTDTKHIHTLQQRKQTVMGSYTHEQEEIYLVEMDDIGYACASLADALTCIEKIIHTGKEKAMQLKQLDLSLKHTDEQRIALLKRKEQGLQRQEQLGIKQQEQNRFHCDKIEGDCPYITMIRGSSDKVLYEQGQHIGRELEEIEKALTRLPDEQELKHQKGRMEKEIDDLRTQLKRIPVSEIQQLHKEQSVYLQEIQQIEKQLAAQQAQIEQLQHRKEQVTILTTTMEGLSQQHIQVQEKRQLLEKKQQDMKKQDAPYSISLLHQVQDQLVLLRTQVSSLQSLVTDHMRTQREVKQLKDEEVKLKQLYTIFSKELLLVVLQDFLPMLEEAMNTFLARMVDYEVRFDLPTQIGEKVELHIDIHDDKGARHAKSLSGGQRSVLKLAWILAVATMMQGKFLFLDETITSLDMNTVAKVADVLEDFVQQHDMKFYVVTHSSQIQAMQIWDTVIEI